MMREGDNEPFFVTGWELHCAGKVQEGVYELQDDDRLPGRFQSLDAHKRLHQAGVCAPRCKFCRFEEIGS